MGGLGGASGGGGTGGGAGSAPPSWFDLPCRIEAWGTPLITAFSPDGSLYAVGGDSGIVKIMRTADDQPIVTVAAHDAAVAVVKIAADNSRFATAGADNQAGGRRPRKSRAGSVNGSSVSAHNAAGPPVERPVLVG
jgi:WD40 repeat protein